MINFEALFKLSYGLYIVCAGDKKHGNGFISNTFFQVTAEPAQFASCCNKDNYTAELIEKYGCFSATVLHENTAPDIFSRFGYKSGRDLDKMESMNVQYGSTGAPIVLNDGAAFLECKVVQKIDVGTHWLFIGELVDAQILDDTLIPITYVHYRNVKKGLAPKNAPTYIDKSKLQSKPEAAMETKKTGQYKCAVCGYIHDEDDEGVKFEDLPKDWVCPICGAEKEDFMEV